MNECVRCPKRRRMSNSKEKPCLHIADFSIQFVEGLHLKKNTQALHKCRQNDDIKTRAADMPSPPWLPRTTSLKESELMLDTPSFGIGSMSSKSPSPMYQRIHLQYGYVFHDVTMYQAGYRISQPSSNSVETKGGKQHRVEILCHCVLRFS